MNSNASEQPGADTETEPAPNTSKTPNPDDEFENEELGERQPEACSLDEGCLSCQ